MKDFKLTMTTVKEENQKITLGEAKEFVLTPPAKVCNDLVLKSIISLIFAKSVNIFATTLAL